MYPKMVHFSPQKGNLSKVITENVNVIFCNFFKASRNRPIILKGFSWGLSANFNPSPTSDVFLGQDVRGWSMEQMQGLSLHTL